jgi:hypothetical protein
MFIQFLPTVKQPFGGDPRSHAPPRPEIPSNAACAAELPAPRAKTAAPLSARRGRRAIREVTVVRFAK